MAGGDERDPPEGSLERRLVRDEIRLARDEERIAQEERWIRRNWLLALVLAGLLALTVAALAISVAALNRDIDAVAEASPRDDSVGSAALSAGAVTPAKLAEGAVTPPALADGAVTRRAVAPNALRGGQIDEATLGSVPRAARADRAGTADRARDATTLAGVAAGRYVSRLTMVDAQSGVSTLEVKGPVRATCPAGTTVIGGGASVDGAARVAITTSAPDGERGWVAEAAALGTPSAPWSIIVTAVCASGG